MTGTGRFVNRHTDGAGGRPDFGGQGFVFISGWRALGFECHGVGGHIKYNGSRSRYDQRLADGSFFLGGLFGVSGGLLIGRCQAAGFGGEFGELEL